MSKLDTNTNDLPSSGWLARLPRSTIMRTFSIAYVIIALMMLFPPFYIWAGRPSPVILWLPFSVFYVVLNAVFITFLIWLLWIVEGIRGEQEVFVSIKEATNDK